MQGKIYSGGRERVTCWECGKVHGAKACPKALPDLREDTWGVMDFAGTKPSAWFVETVRRAKEVAAAR